MTDELTLLEEADEDNINESMNQALRRPREAVLIQEDQYRPEGYETLNKALQKARTRGVLRTGRRDREEE